MTFIKGYVQSLSHRKRLCLAWIKRINKAFNLGRKKTIEEINKISRSLKKYFEFNKPHNKGKKIPEKIKIKISKILKQKGIKPKFIHKFTREEKSKGGKIDAKIVGMRYPTLIEIKLYEELKRRGLLFETQKLINGRFLVDVYVPSLNLIIEADGKYWYDMPKIIKKDKAENAYLIKCGYKLLRLSEQEILNDNFINKIN